MNEQCIAGECHAPAGQRDQHRANNHLWTRLHVHSPFGKKYNQKGGGGWEYRCQCSRPLCLTPCWGGLSCFGFLGLMERVASSVAPISFASITVPSSFITTC